ncbi:hypothetical protein BDV25DRAFT_137576 [Aspergillus avenaceus]|uniref:Uncharacterized protein n=1 Tax=Aspergillus avenaceus TaxID=36643 RepID=A0A5N6U2X3_ASPAV|nr:hypothetical protein BDV25DRAFT_137576 [Aspergillus avenaceus]
MVYPRLPNATRAPRRPRKPRKRKRQRRTPRYRRTPSQASQDLPIAQDGQEPEEQELEEQEPGEVEEAEGNAENEGYEEVEGEGGEGYQEEGEQEGGYDPVEAEELREPQEQEGLEEPEYTEDYADPEFLADVTERLELFDYNTPESLDAAIRGESIPDGLGEEVAWRCVIRGIRHNPGYGRKLRGVLPEFTRALNARDIMSDIIPEMDVFGKPEEVPYCIWHPDVPSEETLGALVKKYPSMAYQAARACAVAGYHALYCSLNVLPEVHIAEEARDINSREENWGSHLIYQTIMGQPHRYSIMDDYTRSVNVYQPRPAPLNGDTAVYSSLQFRQRHQTLTENQEKTDHNAESHPLSNYFNITEDCGLDLEDQEAPWPLHDAAELATAPLPYDLPGINKDFLILLAAYEGNVDRYARLRRPVMIPKEPYCILRGIYHQPIFAMWWETQMESFPMNEKWEFEDEWNRAIQRAIFARHIMSDDVLALTKWIPRSHLPYNIWFPEVAKYSTYETLARLRPQMLSSCLRACIVGDYFGTWEELWATLLQSAEGLSRGERLRTISAVADSDLWWEAKCCGNRKFLDDMTKVPGLVDRCEKSSRYTPARCLPINRLLQHDLTRRGRIFRHIGVDNVHASSDGGLCDGQVAFMSDVELSLFAREELLARSVLEEGQDYVDTEDYYQDLEIPPENIDADDYGPEENDNYENGQYDENGDYVGDGEYDENGEYVENGENAGQYAEEGYAENGNYDEGGNYQDEGNYAEGGEYAENS